MKSSKFFGIFVALISLSLLNGCIAAAPFIAPAGLAFSTVGAAASIHEELTRADFKLSVNVGLEKMPVVAKNAFRELDINFKEAKMAENGNSLVITGEIIRTGKDARNMKVKILAVKVTGKASDVGIWATQDNMFGDIRKPDLAKMVADQINHQSAIAKNKNDNKKAPVIEEAKEESKPATEMKEPAPEIKKAPVKKAPAKKKKPAKKPAATAIGG